MSGFDVPVKTWLPPEVYRKLHKLAVDNDTTVAVLVAYAATKAVTPVHRKRKWTRMTPERFERLVELLKTDMTMAQIAADLGVSRTTIDNHLNRARSQI